MYASQNIHYPAISPLVLLGGGFPTNMSDSEHPSDGATEAEPPIQRSSQFDTVFEQFKGYADSRLHELSTALASNTESSKSLSETKKPCREAEASKLKSFCLRDRGRLGNEGQPISLKIGTQSRYVDLCNMPKF